MPRDDRPPTPPLQRGDWFAIVGLTSAALGWLWILTHPGHSHPDPEFLETPCACAPAEPLGIV